MTMLISTGREKDGRYYAHIPTMPGVMAYGHTQAEAITAVQELAQQVIADEFAHGESPFQEAGVE